MAPAAVVLGAALVGYAAGTVAVIGARQGPN